MQILRAGLAAVAIASGSLLVPDVARAQFGPPGSGCTFTTLQAAINNAIATNQPDIYVAMPASGVLTLSEDVTVPVPSGQQVRIVPADSTCSTPAVSVRPFVWLGAGTGSVVTVTDEGTLTIENTHLMGVDGRGILVVADEAIVHLVDTWVSDGVADYGGGIAIDACASVTVDDGSRIVGNTALIDGGGIWDGPASCGFETIEIRGRIDDNEAAVNGGGLYVDGSRAVLVGEAAIEKNRAVAGSGGGVYAILGATLELEGTMWTPVPEPGVPTGGLRVTDNLADQSGGGIALVGAALSGGPVVIAANVAGEGGGLHVDSAAGAAALAGTADLVNAVFQNNLARGNGGAIAAVTSAAGVASQLTLVGDIDACGWAHWCSAKTGSRRDDLNC